MSFPKGFGEREHHPEGPAQSHSISSFVSQCLLMTAKGWSALVLSPTPQPRVRFTFRLLNLLAGCICGGSLLESEQVDLSIVV